MADFYNKADQKLFEKYQYLPQEKYRLGLNLPTDATEDEVVTDEGIVNTDAFADSGDDGFSITGNAFGEGTPVSPVYGTGLFDGGYGANPITGNLPGGGNIVDEFGIDGDVYAGTNIGGNKLDEFGIDGDVYSTEEEKQNLFSNMFNKVPAALKGVAAIFNPFSIVPTILSSIASGGPQYGIGGLTDQQKELYDALASKGMLFDTSSGMKTMTGKNFGAKGYVEGQMDLAKGFGFDTMTDEEIEDAIAAEAARHAAKHRGNKGFIHKQMKEAYETIKSEKDKENPDDGPGYTGPPTTDYNPNVEVTGPDYGPHGPTTPPGYDGSENEIPDDKIDSPAPPSNNETNFGGGDGPGDQSQQGANEAQNEDNQESAGAGGYRRGGRVKYFYGGKI